MRLLTDLLLPPVLPPSAAAAPTSAQEPARPPVQGLDSVVVNYRTPDDLHTFLASYAAYPCFWGGSLTVVNVSPGPADLAVVARWSDTIGLSHIIFADNVGYARACNKGVLAGQGAVVALFNADVELRPEALTHCYEAIKANPGWGALGPRQVDARNRLVGCGVFGTPQNPQQRAWLAPDVGQCSDLRPDALTVSGSAYFVRRAVWQEMTACPLYRQAAPDAEGAFLPTQHYFEETYLSYHLRAHGYAVVFFGLVVITHLWHRASSPGAEPDRQMGAARQLYRAALDVHGIAHE